MASPVEAADLLDRPPRRLNHERAAALISGRRVMVTGAGGTIGSELTRQVLALGPAAVAVVDADRPSAAALAWKDVGDVTRATLDGLALTDGHRYRFAVRAVTAAGHSVDALSDGAVVGVAAGEGAEPAPDAGTDADASLAGAAEGDGSGCGCRTAPARSASGLGALVALAALALTRSRARVRRAIGRAAS